MTTDTVALLIACLFAVGFVLSFFVGKQVGRYQALKEESKFEIESVEDVTSQFSDILLKIKQSRTIAQAMHENNGKVPNREIYDLIYNGNLKEGKIVCDCGDPEHCDVLRVLREYRKENPSMFTEEELNRDDGL